MEVFRYSGSILRIKIKLKSNTTVWITESLSISRKRIRSRRRLSTVPSERRISRRPLSENLLKESSPIGSITSTTSAGNNNTRNAVWNNPEGGALQWSSDPLNWIVDTKGEIRWFMDSSTIFNVDSIYDGGIMMGLRQNDDGAITWGYGQHYVKYDIMGRRIWNRPLPYGYNDFSHTMDARSKRSLLPARSLFKPQAIRRTSRSYSARHDH